MQTWLGQGAIQLQQRNADTYLRMCLAPTWVHQKCEENGTTPYVLKMLVLHLRKTEKITFSGYYVEHNGMWKHFSSTQVVNLWSGSILYYSFMLWWFHIHSVLRLCSRPFPSILLYTLIFLFPSSSDRMLSHQIPHGKFCPVFTCMRLSFYPEISHTHFTAINIYIWNLISEMRLGQTWSF